MQNISSVDTFNSKIKRIIITEEEIAKAIKKAGEEISATYPPFVNEVLYLNDP